MWKFPTGSGKTVCAINILARLNVKTTILVGQKDLLYQFQKEIKEALNIDVGTMADGASRPFPEGLLTMGNKLNACYVKQFGFSEKDKTKITYQNTAAIQDLMATTECLIADEVHCVGSAPTYYDLNKLWKSLNINTDYQPRHIEQIKRISY